MKYETTNWDQPEDFDRLSEEEQEDLMEWIDDRMEPTKQYRHETSYGLKHVYEEERGKYITNGQFKGAMLKCSYEPKDRDELNWTFKAKLVILG
jgi:hypothetical protein